MARLLSSDPGSRKIGRELPITCDHNISWILGKRVRKYAIKRKRTCLSSPLLCSPLRENQPFSCDHVRKLDSLGEIGRFGQIVIEPCESRSIINRAYANARIHILHPVYQPKHILDRDLISLQILARNHLKHLIECVYIHPSHLSEPSFLYNGYSIKGPVHATIFCKFYSKIKRRALAGAASFMAQSTSVTLPGNTSFALATNPSSALMR